MEHPTHQTRRPPVHTGLFLQVPALEPQCLRWHDLIPSPLASFPPHWKSHLCIQGIRYLREENLICVLGLEPLEDFPAAPLIPGLVVT